MDDKLDLHLSAAQYAALGMFAVCWGHLETEMNFTISALGHIVNDDQTMPHRFSDRIKHWRKLANTYFSGNDGAIASVTHLIDFTKAIHDSRSALLHGRIYVQKDNADTIIIETDRHLNEWRTEVREIETEWVYEGVVLTQETLIALRKFNADHMPVQPSSLPRRYP